jgi:hypothetical protein
MVVDGDALAEEIEAIATDFTATLVAGATFVDLTTLPFVGSWTLARTKAV